MDVIRRLIGAVFPRGRAAAVGAHLRRVRDGTRARQGRSPARSARTSRSTPTTRRWCCPRSRSTSWSRPGWARRSCPSSRALHGADVEAADRFSRTVLTVGTIVMSIGAALLFVLRAAHRASSSCPEYTGAQLEEYIELFRVMCGTTIIFAVSFTHRRDARGPAAVPGVRHRAAALQHGHRAGRARSWARAWASWAWRWARSSGRCSTWACASSGSAARMPACDPCVTSGRRPTASTSGCRSPR